VNAAGYLINSILVLLVLRQIRDTRLTLPSLVLPVLLAAAAAACFLRSVPAASSDVALDITLAAVGAVLGAWCALATSMHCDAEGVVLAKAGWLAGILWVAGVGARMAFAYAAGHGAGPAIARFSGAHHLTGGTAWLAALVMMALAEVTAWLGVMWQRAVAVPDAGTPSEAEAPPRRPAAAPPRRSAHPGRTPRADQRPRRPRSTRAVSSAARTASQPLSSLLPSPPHRSTAWACVSHVSTPLPTGVPLSSGTRVSP
jgi:hypothetical protein